MKNQYFKKDKKAFIYKDGESYQDAYGIWHDGKAESISGNTPLWCYARQNSQTLGFSAGIAYVNEESRFFVFNNNPEIKQGRFILYRDKWFTIQRVDTRDDYNGDMFVYADDTPNGDIPDLD